MQKFKAGDRVLIDLIQREDMPNITKGMIGTVVGYYLFAVLVEFDNFKNGHCGSLFYYSKDDSGTILSVNDKSHWYFLEHQLVKVEKKND